MKDSILISISILLFYYIIAAFVSLKPNPIDWNEFSRGAFCIMWIITSTFIITAYHVFKK